MKDKKIFKKWWFWVIVVIIVLGAIGSLDQSNKDKPTSATSNSKKAADSSTNTTTLPKLDVADYKSKEGLVVYKELRAKGYKVDATFENQFLTDINGKASDLFEPLDSSKPDDKQSVDAFTVGSLTQDGDNVALSITKPSN
ncbi:MAG TPA: hypothetical protein VLG36_01205 [Candidatus Chromulinivoraceae bacterium]|nr:hypothetical protein [Candidatus Chromulinivoraceae bacterium]